MRLLLFFVFIQFVGFSQIVNIENKRIYDDTSGWSGSLDASASLMQNAATLYNVGVRPRIQYKTRKNYYLFLSDLAYTASKTQLFSNSGMAHFRYARRIKNSAWKWESYAQIQYNLLLNQKVRALTGSGFRWKMIDTLKTRIFIGSSLLFEHEELQTEKIINDNWRWSNYISWFANFKQGVSFTGTFYVQPRLDLLKDMRLSGQSAVSFTVSKHFSLRFDVNIFYDRFPPTKVLPLVYSTTAGFSIKIGE